MSLMWEMQIILLDVNREKKKQPSSQKKPNNKKKQTPNHKAI